MPVRYFYALIHKVQFERKKKGSTEKLKMIKFQINGL